MTQSKVTEDANRRGPRKVADDADVCDALIEAAGQLFAEKGFSGVSIREIGQSAKVAPAMIHYYFEDKAGLHAAVFDSILQDLKSRVMSTIDPDAASEDFVGFLIESLTQIVSGRPWMIRLLIREVFLEDGATRKKFIDDYVRLVAPLMLKQFSDEIGKGYLRSDLKPEYVIMTLLGMALFPYLGQPVFEKVFEIQYDEKFREQLASHTVRMFTNGVLG